MGAGKWVLGIMGTVIAGVGVAAITGALHLDSGSGGSNSDDRYAITQVFEQLPPTTLPSGPNTAATVSVPAGSYLKVFSQPSLSSQPVGTLASGARVAIFCTAQGDTVVAGGTSSSLWDGIGDGFVPDVFVYTGTNQATMGPCT